MRKLLQPGWAFKHTFQSDSQRDISAINQPLSKIGGKIRPLRSKQRVFDFISAASCISLLESSENHMANQQPLI